jgi:Class II flagellar assembly regulator
LRIDANSRVDAPAARRAARAKGKTGGFAAAFDVEPQTKPADIVAPGIVEGLLAFQEVEDATAGLRRRAWQRGSDLLDRLEELKHGILDGGYPLERLTELAQLARSSRVATGDPRLDEVLGEIELRAAVEIAKLQRDP